MSTGTTAGLVVQIATILGGTSGLAALVYVVPRYRQLKADARRVGVETDIAEDSAVDARWRQLVQTQAEAIVEPLRQELDRTNERVKHLEQSNAELRGKYRAAVRYIRALLLWASRTMPRGTPEPPRVPLELADEV